MSQPIEISMSPKNMAAPNAAANKPRSAAPHGQLYTVPLNGALPAYQAAKAIAHQQTVNAQRLKNVVNLDDLIH